MRRYLFADSIDGFLNQSPDQILGALAANNTFSLEGTQRDAWVEQVRILQATLPPFRGQGSIYFEYSVPRLGKRIDVVALIGPVVFVLEFKVGEVKFPAHALDQVFDYALDLKNFHEPSHALPIAPVLIATDATARPVTVATTYHDDGVFQPIKSNPDMLAEVIRVLLSRVSGPTIDAKLWDSGQYSPTPTIIEAATALYGGHSVSEISRSDADAVNLTHTSGQISKIIAASRTRSQKSICFVTGVPGAGKTLVGLDIATQHMDAASDLYSVFLSGNGPLVAILREALTRDQVNRAKEAGARTTKDEAGRKVAAFIQNVHHFRDESLVQLERPPVEHVALFDEAQRAWDLQQTSNFMRRKRQQSDFHQSEPEFLISCLDRHPDWAVIVCLVGGGQEINTGEAGISEWVESLIRRFRHWQVYISSRLVDSEYAAGGALQRLEALPHVVRTDELHLGVSMRSFRAERVSLLIKQVLDLDEHGARQTLRAIADRYPVAITRDLRKAKQWLRERSRGSERFGLVASSEAQRLKADGVDVRSPMDPVHWFLNSKDDVRSSYYLEQVATEFHVQGLELDWACVAWDADFRYAPSGWTHWSFCGDRWTRIRSVERQTYLKNAYRVLLTRARQGLIIWVPAGDDSDPTRTSEHYDPTFRYLRDVGFPEI